MAMTPVTHYAAQWNVNSNTPHIEIELLGHPGVLLLPINSEAEFSALVLMLSKQPVLFDPASGQLLLPRRAAGT
jgi:hypothetical protein